ncbi:MAG TPA: beta-ketoacyl-ACP synthase [Crenotrichaceae bacterium]|nr:beta-ketoacyl-ACP synthase [Crenotrichaceae bacterium]
MHTYLNSAGVTCSLGENKAQVLQALLSSTCSSPVLSDDYSPDKPVPLSPVSTALPPIPTRFSSYTTRTNQLLLAALDQIRIAIDHAISHYGRSRVAIIIGTTTSGIAEGELAISHHRQHGSLPAGFSYKQQQLSSTSEFISKLLNTSGPVYAISTSCSSSSSAICSAQRLLANGLADAVVVGGSDALCQTTIQGFNSLGAISKTFCNPFSRHRDGIMIGEGAAVFLMSRDPDMDKHGTPVCLLGTGMCSDAHHISAPDPTGVHARQAMQCALQEANLGINDIDYINLHGTGTVQNDRMESHAVHSLFGEQTACSSTKPLTGHCLGASGAIELALCWLLVSDHNQQGRLPSHIWDQQPDPLLAKINLLGDQPPGIPPSIVMSNTYSFGGNNVSLIIGSRQ